MKKTVFTNPYKLSHEMSTIIELFEKGLETLHIRKPGYSKKEYSQFLNEIPNKFHSRIIVHDYFDIATKYNVKGFHLNYDQANKIFSKLKIKKLLNKKPNIQLSVTIQSLKSVPKIKEVFSKIYISPIFTKLTEKSYSTSFDLAKLKSTVSMSKRNFVALGGVYEQTMHKIKKLGFQEIVLQGAIWKSHDPINTFLNFENFEISEKISIKAKSA